MKTGATSATSGVVAPASAIRFSSARVEAKLHSSRTRAPPGQSVSTATRRRRGNRRKFIGPLIAKHCCTKGDRAAPKDGPARGVHGGLRGRLAREPRGRRARREQARGEASAPSAVELGPNGVLGNSCGLSSTETAPVASQQPVFDGVLVGPPPLVVLRPGALVAHPDLLHHPPGGRVAPEVLRVDAVKP